MYLTDQAVSADGKFVKSVNIVGRAGRSPNLPKINIKKLLLPFLYGLAFLGICPAPLAAQQIQPTSQLYFSMLQNGASPLLQILPVASTTTGNFYFTAVASTTTGGNWLSVPSGSLYTPSSVLVSINGAVAGSLAAGSYSGKITVAASGGSPTETVAVTLTISSSTQASFANLPGGLTYALATGGGAGAQVIQINNAGAGSLNWTLSANTFNNSNFLTVSANAGTAPSLVSIGIAAQNLPGGGTTAGTFVGQLIFTSSSGSVTVPVAVSVGGISFIQVNPLAFSMPVGGAAPLPQIVPGASNSSGLYFRASAYTATGGNWLSVSPQNTALYTPSSPVISVDEAVAAALPVGVYTAEVVVTPNSTGGAPTMSVPVTLTVSPVSVPFFDSVPGGMNFFLSVDGSNPGGQTLQLRNAGSGTLNWTAVPSTADGGNWLSVSTSSGTAPTVVTVQVATQNLPGGAAAGTYSGNILFESSNSTVTVPITVSVGITAFLPVYPLSAAMPLNTTGPLVQAANISSTASGFYFNTAVYTATGGNWLTASTVSGSVYTPNAVEVGFNQAVVSSLPVGNYTGEVVVSGNSTGTASALTIPVSLTVGSSSAPFFDDLPGGLQFSVPVSGASPGSQVIQVRNAGQGSLGWTVTTTTPDGGKWLTASPGSGTAPSLVTVGVLSQNLPGGAAAGIYNGTVLFQSAGGTAAVPITVSVGGTGFVQVNPISFNMPFSGSVPLSQSVSISSSSSGFYYDVSSSTATGGNWLTVAPGGTLYTPDSLTLGVNQSVASSLPAGIYTAEAILTPHSGGTAGPVSLPVTLTVSQTTGPFFDTLPGGLQFTLQAHGGNPASQIFQIRNAGTGTLNWSVLPITADGGKWLTTSITSGAAPGFISASVLAQNLPGGGAAGTYSGSLLFESGSIIATVPITVTVGTTGLAQVNPISFVMPASGRVPLPQELALTTLTSTGFYVNISTASSTGGNWLKASLSGTYYPPQSLTVSVDQGVASSLGAGSYTAEIIVTPYSSGNSAAPLSIPVTLTIAPTNVPFFDNLPGGLYYSTSASGTAPAAQTVSLRNEGSGQLSWTALATTSDGGNWLTISSIAGTAPSSLTVGIAPQNLPSQGAVTGTYTGQILLQSSNGNVTVPVTVDIGPNVFLQANGLVFNLSSGASSQTLNVAQIGGGGININAASFTGNGGNWLSLSPSGGTSTPRSFTFTANTGSLARGSYTAEAVFVPTSGAAPQTVPVTLNVSGTPPASITVVSGTPQTALLNANFASPFVAVVQDASGNILPGVAVTITAPSTGASGSFSGQLTVNVTTDASGKATSPIFTANATGGSYTVTASATGIGASANFALTNNPATLSSISITAPNTSILVGASQQFTANGVYSDGSSANITAQVVWNSSSTAAATIAAGGLASAIAAGTTNITAALNGIASNSFTLLVYSGLRFVPVAPCRVADTRKATGPFGGPLLSGGAVRNFTIPSSTCGIPANAQAFAMNVTVVPVGTLNYLTAWPSGSPQPLVSTLNSPDGRIKANAVIVPAGASGAVSFFATDDTNLVLDIDGYFVPASLNASALAFYPLAPCRLVDTRPAAGPLGSASLTGGVSVDLPILTGNCDVPATAQAYSLNFTVVPKVGQLGYLATWPTGLAQPIVSTLNDPTGTVVANAALVPAGTSGKISVYATDDTDLIVDINGYFAAAGTGGLSLYSVTPCRVIDTRIPSGSQPFTGTLQVNFPASACGIPSSGQAYVLNATVVPPAALNYLSLWPTGQVQPVVSTLNAFDGVITSNMAIVPATIGLIDAFASNPTYLILDISSYFAP